MAKAKVSGTALLVSKVTADGKSIVKMIKSLASRVAKLNNDKAIAAASCIMHAIEHGQCTPMRDLKLALGDTERGDALVKWACTFGPLKWDKDPDTKQNTFFMDTERAKQLRTEVAKDREAFITKMIVEPYWVFLPPPVVAPFDINASFWAWFNKAKKAKDEGRAGNFENFDKVEALTTVFKKPAKEVKA